MMFCVQSRKKNEGQNVQDLLLSKSDTSNKRSMLQDRVWNLGWRYMMVMTVMVGETLYLIDWLCRTFNMKEFITGCL